MVLLPVDLRNDLDLCIAFRRDAHILSYGTDEKFDRDQCVKWFETLKEESVEGLEVKATLRRYQIKRVQSLPLVAAQLAST